MAAAAEREARRTLRRYHDGPPHELLVALLRFRRAGDFASRCAVLRRATPFSTASMLFHLLFDEYRRRRAFLM